MPIIWKVKEQAVQIRHNLTVDLCWEKTVMWQLDYVSWVLVALWSFTINEHCNFCFFLIVFQYDSKVSKFSDAKYDKNKICFIFTFKNKIWVSTGTYLKWFFKLFQKSTRERTDKFNSKKWLFRRQVALLQKPTIVLPKKNEMQSIALI